MSKKIKLTQGKSAIVDNEDYGKLASHKWYALKSGRGYLYAVRDTRKGGKLKRFYMHREVINPKRGMFVDHSNHDGLDNRKGNLRICTNAENCRNQRASKSNATGLKGIHWHKRDMCWQAGIRTDGRNIYLGSFGGKKDAAYAYNVAAKKYFGE